MTYKLSPKNPLKEVELEKLLITRYYRFTSTHWLVKTKSNRIVVIDSKTKFPKLGSSIPSPCKFNKLPNQRTVFSKQISVFELWKMFCLCFCTCSKTLVFHIFGALAEFERLLIKERTNAGLASARARGRVGGRPKAMDEKKIQIARSLHADGKTSISEICKTLKVSKASL
jgi:hypothetical protein